MGDQFKVSGPRGGVIIRHAPIGRLRRVLPGLVRRFGKVTVSPAEHTTRERMVEVMRVLLAAESKVHYAQLRPMRSGSIANVAELRQVLATASGLKMDCSESVTLICRLAGAPDPNGRGYDGSGFTGTLLEHLRPTTARRARVGDLVVFGPDTGRHVCVVLEAGADSLLFSHGQEKGPIALRLSVEAAFQSKPVRFLSTL